jgi:hypothetical protein
MDLRYFTILFSSFISVTIIEFAREKHVKKCPVQPIRILESYVAAKEGIKCDKLYYFKPL